MGRRSSMRTTLSRFTLALLTTAATLSVASCGQVPAKRAAGARGRPPQSREAIHVPAAPTRRVTDGVGLLSEAARRELDVSLERYEKETGHQVIVWIGDSTHGQRLEDFATRSFNAWGIGRKGANDGVAFFVFSDDRKIRLEVGDGLVGVLPDSTAAAIINEVVMPRLASGEKDQALVKGVAVTLRVLNGEQWKSLEGAFRAPSSDAALAPH
jgi:uncharacterized membrane protein YgcG